MAVEVQNVRGTSGAFCFCSSRLDHWKRYGGGFDPICAEVTCEERKVIGVHVQRQGSRDWWIIPLCRDHNARADRLAVKDDTKFVLAASEGICGLRRQ